MSCICTVAAVGSIALPAGVFSSLVTAAAAQMGLRSLQAAERTHDQEDRQDAFAQTAQSSVDALRTIEVSTAQRAGLEEIVAERCTLHFVNDEIELTVDRDIRGKLTVRVHSDALDQVQTTERANAMLGRILQAVAYREVVSKMREHGFEVAEEERLEDGTARIRIRRK
jgi:hypothetical protein